MVLLVASAWLLPFLAGVLAAVFAARVWGQFSARRRPHQFAWGLGLTFYAAASFIEAYVAQNPWSVPLYEVYFPLAGATVGLLGLGTVFLARLDKWTALYAAATGLAIVITIVGPFGLHLAPGAPIEVKGVTQPLASWGTQLGSAAVPFSNPARWSFLLLNVVGGLALIGGALTSYQKTRRTGVLLIGVGAVLPFAGGSLASIGGLDARILLQLLGIAVMFAGYLQGREVPSRVPAPAES